MAWLNLNDSLNSIKGQISNLATDFLSDGIIQSGSNQSSDENLRVKELEDVIVSQQNEIDKLKSEIEELSKLVSEKQTNNVSQNVFNNHDDSWDWTEHNSETTTASNNLKLTPKNDFHLTKTIDEILRINSRIKEINTEIVTNNSEINTIDNENSRIKQLLIEQTELQDRVSQNYEQLKILITCLANNDLEPLIEENKRLTLENQELLINLNQLDQDCQQTTEKLVVLRDTLQVDLNKMRAEYDQLTQKNHELEKQLEQTQKEKQQYQIYYQQFSTLEHQMKIQQTENMDREKRYQVLEKDLSDMTTKFENALSLSTNYKKQLSDIFNLLNKHYKTKFTVTDDLNHFTSQISTLETILTQQNTVEPKLMEVAEEKNTIIQKQEQLLNEYTQNITNLNDQVKNLNSELSFYKQECNELRENNEKLLEDLKLMDQHLNLETIPETNEECVAQLENLLEKSNTRVKELENQLKDESSAHTQLLEQVTQLEQERHHLLNDKNSLENSITNLTSEFSNLKQNYDAQTQELEFSRTQMKSLEEKLKTSKMNETALKLQLDTYKKELEHSWDQKNAIKPLELKIQKLEQEIVEKNSQLVENQQIIETGKEWEKKYLASAHQITYLQKEIERLQNEIIDKDNTTRQLQEILETKEKELQLLKESNEQLQNDRCDKDSTEKNELLENALREKETENMKLIERIAEFESQINTLKTNELTFVNKIQNLEQQLNLQTAKIQSSDAEYEKLKNDFNELMKVVSIKHTENVNYHNEIQRLNTILVEEKQKYEQALNNSQELSELQMKIQELNKQLEQLQDKNNFLSEKCDILTQNLLTEQSKLYELSETHQQCSHAVKELERLRQHLLQLEETHTQEMLTAERKQKELEEKVLEMEQRERDNSTIYTSVSIRANQQVETLQKQIQLANQQRDEYQMKLSEAEDRQMKQMAALTNLQCVLEQFQKDKEKEIEEATQSIYKKLHEEFEKEKQLQHEIELLKSQLNESKQGLKAASRLQEQLEKCRHQICTLKDEVRKSNEQLTAREKQIKEMMSQTESKVDKTLVKNLLIGYLTSSNQNNKDVKQILKVIGTVLDFSKDDYEKINYDTSGGSWLKSILRPSSVNSDGTASETSLSEAFIRFLENESRPKPELPLLPPVNRRRESVDSDISTSSRASQISATSAPTSLLLNQVLLPTFDNLSHTRNSSSILKDVLRDNTNK